MAEKVGLQEFANKRQNKPTQCWVCSLPERKEIDEAIRAGSASGADIADWLVTQCGYNAGHEVVSQRVRRHRKDHLNGSR